VNANHSSVRQRFTIAHEIGHFIYHRGRLEKCAEGGTSDTLAYRTDDRVYPNPHITWLQEYQANNFASNLLIPSHLLAEQVAKGATEEEMARHFNVSLAAIRIKLGKTPGRVAPAEPTAPAP
jgi:Zn-dependent peptidase ImmA (M78 family)